MTDDKQRQTNQLIPTLIYQANTTAHFYRIWWVLTWWRYHTRHLTTKWAPLVIDWCCDAFQSAHQVLMLVQFATRRCLKEVHFKEKRHISSWETRSAHTPNEHTLGIKVECLVTFCNSRLWNRSHSGELILAIIHWGPNQKEATTAFLRIVICTHSKHRYQLCANAFVRHYARHNGTHTRTHLFVAPIWVIKRQYTKQTGG